MSNDYIPHDHHHDGIDRRGCLTGLAWAGTGVLWRQAQAEMAREKQTAAWREQGNTVSSEEVALPKKRAALQGGF